MTAAKTKTKPAAKADATPELSGVKATLDLQPVRYAMNVSKLSIRPKDKQVVQLKTGEWERIPTQALKLVCESIGGDRGVTRAYDPKIEADAHVIAEVDAFIESGHRAAIDNGLRKLSVADEFVPQPFSRWYETKPARILEILKLGEFDLAECMKYELQNPDGGPRQEVLNAIESLGKQKQIEAQAALKRADAEADIDF